MSAVDILRNLGLVVIPFTLYFAWTKIGFRVVVQPTWSVRRHAASGIGRLTLINMKDRSLAIFQVHAVFNGMVFPLKDFDPPLILKSYEAANVEIPEVSNYYVGNQLFEWNAGIDLHKIDIFLSTASKMVKCKHGSPPSRIGFARRWNNAIVTTHTKMFNGRIYNDNVKYAIGYRLDGVEQTSFIDQSGFIDWQFAPNMLRAEHVVSEDAVRNVLDASGIGQIIGRFYIETLRRDSCTSDDGPHQRTI
ncbi:hypothetical protein MK974_31010 [Burkholderia ambifaria]|uniref:hypothetical protein n=1 Tax=Burkholderia ambifaria TaxID=152480 RepID=UPI0022A95651|nr:hypothetical protein [Burkholderia ambifaria]WAS58275.1 hypothetical protein MK974_31010 [Burkholderia ambifaria]